MIFIGLLTMIVSEGATLARIEPFWSWNTPIAWTGFILFADGVVWRARGRSWLKSSPWEFAFLALVSIPLWLIFEFYNLFIDNWHYVGLPSNHLLRYFGYAWSFATIWPAIFEGADLMAVVRRVPDPHRHGSHDSESSPGCRRDGAPRVAPSAGRWTSIAAGVAMLAGPLLWPSRYLAAPVWLGFIFLLDPVTAWLGGDSLAADLARGSIDRVVNLGLSGLACGFLWEFWNYWARAKWIYTVPILEHVKLFEMPLPGYLGFPAFALECFTMYAFVRRVCNLPAAAI